jgi:hypothetical protein
MPPYCSLTPLRTPWLQGYGEWQLSTFGKCPAVFSQGQVSGCWDRSCERHQLCEPRAMQTASASGRMGAENEWAEEDQDGG